MSKGPAPAPVCKCRTKPFAAGEHGRQGIAQWRQVRADLHQQVFLGAEEIVDDALNAIPQVGCVQTIGHRTGCRHVCSVVSMTYGRSGEKGQGDVIDVR